MTELVTTRLRLRPPELADFLAWARLASDARVLEEGEAPPDEAGAWKTFLGVAGSWRLLGFGVFAVFERDTGAFVGRVGPHRPHGWPAGEIGWVIDPAFQSRGYALEAAQASADWVFETLGWDRAIHTIRPTNTASQRIAVRLGAVNLGPIALPPPFENIPNDEWSLSRDAWVSRRSA